MIYLILLIGLYLPLEDSIVKWLQPTHILYAKQLPDFILFMLYLVAFFLVFNKYKLKIFDKKIFFLFTIFVFYSITIAIINENNIIYALIQIKSFIRYMPLIFILYVVRNITSKTISTFLKILALTGVFESIIGIMQYHNEVIRNFFKFKQTPEVAGFVISYSSIFVKKDVFGTMAHTINYAYFLLISLAVLVFIDTLFKNHYLKYLFIVFHLVAIYYSGSRAALICALFMLVIAICIRRDLLALSMLSGMFSIFPIFVTIVGKGQSDRDFWFFLNPRYIETLRLQRLGIIEEIFLNFIQTKYFLFGFGPDHFVISDFISSNFDISISWQFAHRAIEDVYWVALFVYYGLVGFLILLFFLFLIWKRIFSIYRINNKKKNYFLMKLSILSLVVLGLSFLLCFVNQIYEVRTYSYYMWLFIGLVLNQAKYVGANRFSVFKA